MRTIANLAGTTGNSRILVCEPDRVNAQFYAGLLSAKGYTADTTFTGRRLLKQAFDTPDYELVFITANVSRPDALELVQQIRRDSRTANLPVILVGEEHQLERLHRFAETSNKVVVSQTPGGVAAMDVILSQATKFENRSQLTNEQRLAQSNECLDYFEKIAANRNVYSFYDLLPHTQKLARGLFDESRSEKVSSVLGVIGSRTAQTELIALINQPSAPLKLRQAAANAFDVAVQKRGTMLKLNEIREQYRRYNSSEKLDEGTQQVFASVLDSMEKRANGKN